ncbi:MULTISPECIES: hypothetical protein [Bacillus cereus group]|uniref:hypothetical protein n=1 Tax=Bacillus cereus group TaxID=86661 RepID=UPI0022E68C34|nr:hypothetical protein [Bacillus cereus group sp. TH152-1LC]MDA1674989.1 hypothetical protein [Bacillus cereus group sp. TH152-1LC]
MKVDFITLKNTVNEETLVKEQIIAAKEEVENAQIKYENSKKSEEKERNDVVKLNGFSLNNAVYSLIGKKDEKLKKEKAELQEATNNVQTAEATLLEKRRNLSELELRFKKIEEAKIKYNAILSLKEKELLNKGLLAIIELNRSLDSIQKELNSYENVLSFIPDLELQLTKTISALKEAENLGLADIATNNLGISLLKKDALDEGINELKKLNKMLSQLKSLKDSINISKENTTNISDVWLDDNELLMALDLFVDNIFVDWQVQQDIERYLNSTMEIKKSIYNFKQILKKKQNELLTEQQVCTSNKINIIEFHILSQPN